MIYFLSLILIAFLSACMDASKGIANFCKKKGWNNLYEFWNSDSWENKYDMRNWLEKFLPVSVAKFLAMDVLVIFSDGWHLSKAIMFGIIEYYVAVLSFAWVNQVLTQINFPWHFNLFWYWVFLFLLTGQVFNQFYYKLRKL